MVKGSSEGSRCSGFFKKLMRKKWYDPEETHRSSLNRVLNVFDLALLGVGAMCGGGVYVISGQILHYSAGPALFLSFLIAGAASFLSALCYAELASMVPHTGSAYAYSYICVGELPAFIIAWNMILENIIGGCSVARSWSAYLDYMLGYPMSPFFNKYLHLGGVNFLAPYADPLAFAITAFITVILAVGVSHSARFNNIFTSLNLIIVLYIIICGSFKADVHNWDLTVKPEECSWQSFGQGGFLPHGFMGVWSGAASCFYGYVGFDAIATTADEAHNPTKQIPRAIMLSLVICICAYFGLSIVLSLMYPFCGLYANATLQDAFWVNHWPVAMYIVAIGSVFGLSTGILGSMFALPRIIYSMSHDGLLFEFLGYVNPVTQTPIWATIIPGLLAATTGMLLSLQQLVEMYSIGTLMAYTIVAGCVLVKRYEPSKHHGGDDQAKDEPLKEADSLLNGDKPTSFRAGVQQILFPAKHPTDFSSAFVNVSILCIGILFTIMGCFLFFLVPVHPSLGWSFSAAVLFLLILPWTILICRQRQSHLKHGFKVPLVPLIPLLSICFNVLLMLKLQVPTWIRLAVWLFIGMAIYIFYGIRHSRGHMLPDPTLDDESSTVPDNESPPINQTPLTTVAASEQK